MPLGCLWSQWSPEAVAPPCPAGRGFRWSSLPACGATVFFSPALFPWVWSLEALWVLVCEPGLNRDVDEVKREALLGAVEAQGKHKLTYSKTLPRPSWIRAGRGVFQNPKCFFPSCTTPLPSGSGYGVKRRKKHGQLLFSAPGSHNQPKERTHPELLAQSRPRLFALAIEPGRPWGAKATDFIRQLARARV